MVSETTQRGVAWVTGASSGIGESLALALAGLVILPPTHDTAAAVLAVPMADHNSVYLSSGTWSLIGVERT